MLRGPHAIALHRRPIRRRFGALPLFATLLAATYNLAPPIAWLRGKPIYPISGGAVAVNFLNSTTSTANTTSYASTSFTPTAGSTLVVFVNASDTQAATPTMTDSQSLGFEFIRRARYATNVHEVACFVAKKPAAASSMTVTFDCTGDAATGAYIAVSEVTGISRAGFASILQRGSTENGAAAGTPAASFAFATQTANPVFGFVGNNSNPAGMTPPTSFTEVDDTGYNTPTTGGELAYRIGHNAAAVTWGGTSATTFGVLTLEVDVLPQACIQSDSTTGTASSTTVARAFKVNLSAGSTLLVGVYWNSNTFTCTVAGSTNGAFTSNAAVLRGAGTLAAYSSQTFRKTGATAGAETITATFSSAVTDYGIAIEEANGTYNTFDQSITSNYPSGTNPVTSSMTPAHNSSFIFEFVVFGTSPGAIGGGGFTFEEFTGLNGNVFADQTQTTAAAVQGTFGATGAQDAMTHIGCLFSPAASTANVIGWLR